MNNIFLELKKNLVGEFRESFDLSKSTWLNIGGEARFFFIPKDIKDLQTLIKNNNNKLPIKIIGSGSNLLIRDKGFDGIIIKFGKEFDYVTLKKNILSCGPSTLKSTVARFALDNNLKNLEFLNCIPGTVAGGIIMNSGCYGSDMSKIVKTVTVIDNFGVINILTNKQINFSYRNSSIKQFHIIINVDMEGVNSDKSKILKTMETLKSKKTIDQPQRIKTGGSTFKNPINSKKKAWQLIKDSDCSDFSVGNIKLSKIHCNFLENTGNATSDDAELLINKIKLEVKKKTNINLELELEVIGNK